MTGEGEGDKVSNEKVLVIRSWWAGVFASLLVALIVGVVAFAWNANASIAVLQSSVKGITESNLDVRLARMEEKIDWLVKYRNAKR